LINGLLPAPKLSLPLIKDADVARTSPSSGSSASSMS
jgi:hypothetical protein